MSVFTYTEDYTEDMRRKALLADVRGGLGSDTTWSTVLLVTRNVSTETLDSILGAVPYEDTDKGTQQMWLLLMLQGARFEAQS